LPEAVIKLRVSIETDDAEPWTGEGIAGVAIKAEDERRYGLYMAYPANKPDIAVAKDGCKDFAGPDAIEDAAWSYLSKSSKVGLWHQDGTEGAGDVVESYIYRGPDWVIKAADDSEQTVKSGDWLVGIRWSEDTWPAARDGRIGGVSMQGKATRQKPSPETVLSLRS
jgi:hypothetical protein